MKGHLIAFGVGTALALPFLVLKHFLPASYFLVLTACEFGVFTFAALRVRGKLK